MEKESHSLEANRIPEAKETELPEITSHESYVEALRESERREIASFERNVEEIVKRLQVDERFDRLGSAMDELEEFLQEDTEPLDEARIEQYLEEFGDLEGRFKKGMFPQFQSWLREEIRNEKSPLRREAETWSAQQTTKAWWDTMARGFASSHLLSETRKHAINSSVVKRLQALHDLVESARQPTPIRVEDIFRHYLQTTAADRAANPGWTKKLFGTSAKKEHESLLREVLNPDWAQATQASSISNAEELKISGSFNAEGHLKKDALRWKPLNFGLENERKRLKEARALAFEESDLESPISEPTLEDWSEYRNKTGLPESSDEVIRSLKPLLGRNKLVSKVKFELESEQVESGHAAGSYNSKDHVIRMYPGAAYNPTEFARVLAHESGHAMQLEENLSLAQALRFGIEMNASVVQEGYVSRYSKEAQRHYMERMGTTMTRSHLMNQWEMKKFADFISDASIHEEWAEMMAFSITPSVFNRVSPVKAALVKKYASKFGLDVDQARERVAAANPVGTFRPDHPSTWGPIIQTMTHGPRAEGGEALT